MLGGLYGDLPPPSSAGDDDKASTASVWSSATKMAPPTLRKPASTFAPPPSLLRNQHPRPPKAASTPAPPIEAAASFQPAFVAVQSTVLEEYDPARPNDYEDYRKDKLRRAKEAELSKELERRRREEQEREKEREQREREAREREERDYQSRASSLNISGEEAWKRRAAMSGASAAQRTPSSPPQVDGFAIGSSSSAGLGVGAGGQMTAAQRMMAKMGWKEGQGLGKQEQGITAPLVAKKTDRRGGVIIDESNSRSEKKPKSVNFDGQPTRVLLLRNMVGPGEVDDELEDEVASECARYGTVSRVLIFEITQANFPADEAVRIFIQFERAEEATKAMIDLQGRFFGGRVVQASFFDEEKFGRNELAPMPGEVPGFFD
ncbi:DNA-damage-repair/toleration protein DRT111, chloroplastic [Phragmites australis]|uniref:DNA-damage-repair/toleration protein DRT111, chloroplastic n=1 Tax=Phragmites australis TaxID=29695 RepID=UPI002D765F7C|nr:DNA-damage-repair/toleration protein DRT111, chloroplastic [Phragmites australis]